MPGPPWDARPDGCHTDTMELELGQQAGFQNGQGIWKRAGDRIAVAGNQQ
nr:hypothetical protein [Marinobacter sp. DS40M8]